MKNFCKTLNLKEYSTTFHGPMPITRYPGLKTIDLYYPPLESISLRLGTQKREEAQAKTIGQCGLKSHMSQSLVPVYQRPSDQKSTKSTAKIQVQLNSLIKNNQSSYFPKNPKSTRKTPHKCNTRKPLKPLQQQLYKPIDTKKEYAAK